jgi:hypothetical protein
MLVVLVLDNALNITPRISINDDAGLWAGCTTALERTPVPDVATACRCACEADRNWSSCV